MPNGYGLLGDASSSQSSIILKKPGGQKLYYIFTVDHMGGDNGLNYSIVDMSLNGGLGDVDVLNKNKPIRGKVREKLAAARHSNGSDFWILTTDFLEDRIFAYHLGCSGLDLVPVKSDYSGSIYSGVMEQTLGCMKASRQNDKIAIATWGPSPFIIFDFDNSTGKAFKRVDIKSPNRRISTSAYGIEFSPDGKLLYATTVRQQPGVDTPTFYQFNLAHNSGVEIADSAIILATHPSIFSSTPYYYGALQLGSDAKIYSANFHDTTLGVINNPNLPGISCDYVNGKVSLGRKRGTLGLPNILPDYVIPLPLFVNNVFICANNQYTLCDGTIVSARGVYVCHVSTPTICDSTIITNLAVYPIDTTRQSITICQNALPYVWHRQSLLQTGVYYDILPNAAANGCDSIIYLNLTVIDSVRAKDTSICNGGRVFLEGTYQTIEGYYKDLIQDNGCPVLVITHLTVHALPKPDLGPNDTICYRGRKILEPLNLNRYTSYLWSTGETSARISVEKQNIYSVKVTDVNGCVGTGSIEIIVGPCKKPVIPNVFSPNDDGVNDVWNIKYLTYYPGCTVSVYTRYGQPVYNSIGYNTPWDGIWNKKTLPTGTYYYIIDLRNGEKPLTGNVSILR